MSAWFFIFDLEGLFPVWDSKNENVAWRGRVVFFFFRSSPAFIKLPAHIGFLTVTSRTALKQCYEKKRPPFFLPCDRLTDGPTDRRHGAHLSRPSGRSHQSINNQVHVVQPGIDPAAPPPPSPTTPADKPPSGHFSDDEEDNNEGGGRDSLGGGDTEAFAIDESEGEEASYPPMDADVRGGVGGGEEGRVLGEGSLSSASYPSYPAVKKDHEAAGGGRRSSISGSETKTAKRLGRQKEEHAFNQAISRISEMNVDLCGGARQGKGHVFEEALSSAVVESGEGARGEETSHPLAGGGGEKGAGGAVVVKGDGEMQEMVEQGGGEVQQGSPETINMVKVEDFLAANSTRSDDPLDSCRMTCDV